MAIRRRFDIDTRKAAEEVNALMDSDDPRIKARALQIAVLMESMNQRDEHKAIDVHVTTRHDQLAGIAADLGIDVALIDDAARQADSGVSGTEK